MPVSESLKRTPLYSAHVALGAKMVPFGGWEMPVYYSSIMEEHHAVRQRVGLFDISHMGEFIISGPQAELKLNQLLTNDIRRCALGQAQYSLLCNDDSGIIDDLIVYRLNADKFLLVVNASNIAGDLAWFRARLDVEDHSGATAALALQGPDAAQLLGIRIPHFHIGSFNVFGVECRAARTGYTGEDGFELLCHAGDAARLWTELLARGAQPCGLGARDTLRMEMCYPLHGQDITTATTPLEAGLGRFVALDKPDFIGRAALLAQQARGLTRKLAAFKMIEKAPPPRPHYPLFAGNRRIGEVTSGAPSPSLGIGIGMGYVEADAAAPGTPIGVQIRDRMFAAVIETKPFWKKKK
ncbi:MAG: glycine cleavage system aminomethyltransferase GcvT [Verrucomicrobia bacterium]|nr:glycine cleavage system aminomethyltransferase GcvT [Verrucomicrobiota bacterium]